MYFVLSKLLLLLIFPLTWVIAMMLYAVFTKKERRKKTMLLAATITLISFSNPFVANTFASWWDVERYTPTAVKYSAVILLGGFVSEDYNGNGYFNWAADRYIQATKLLLDRKVSHLLFTGGSSSLTPDGFSEAAFVKSELRKLNIADSLTLMEGRSRNTFENAAYSKPILQKAGLKPPYLLVTSAFHMRRAELIFKKAGIDVVAYPCNFTNSRGNSFINNLTPSTEALSTWNFYLKEIVGYLVASIR